MAKVFSFEREIHETLELMPMAVRRLLDLARLKLSLAAWQALSTEQRRELVDAPGVEAFSGALRRTGASVEALGPAPDPFPWQTATVPPPVRARLDAAGAHLEDAAWSSLDDDARYVLLKLAESKREGGRFLPALAELGIG